MQWKWIFWQVVVPTVSPILISALVALLWWTGNSGSFAIDWKIILDVSPWALTFYSLALIGSTMNDFWGKLQAHAALGLAMLFVALAVTLYAAFIVIWRHDKAFVPGAGVYFVTVLLLVISIILCHMSYARSK